MLEGREGEDLQPSKQLEPNDVADIKRDLAEKGIIALPPDLPSQNQKQKVDKNTKKDSELPSNDRVQDSAEGKRKSTDS